MGAVFDALVFSNLWVAGAAVALCAAASLALGSVPGGPLLGLVLCGTLVVYNVDRLRDLERDRVTAPERSAFVARHRRALVWLTGVAALAAAVLVLRLGPGAWWLLLPVLAAGLLHRRLKRLVWFKPAYLVGAWLAVTAGLPAVRAGATASLGWVLLLFATALMANAAASNLRDAEGASAWLGERTVLRAARTLCAAGVLAATLAPPLLAPLGLVPGLTLVALVGFRADERYGLVVVDGALLVGGALACLWLA